MRIVPALLKKSGQFKWFATITHLVGLNNFEGLSRDIPEGFDISEGSGIYEGFDSGLLEGLVVSINQATINRKDLCIKMLKQNLRV